jgi:endonuclease/exonuclease/phosphatase family metal-dependent hydrolase
LFRFLGKIVDMKLLQLNAWSGRLEKQIQHLIVQEKPDVICLQEALSIKGGSNGGWFLTVDDIKQLYGMDLVYSPTISFSFMRRKAEFGNAIFVKGKIVDEKTVFTRLEYKKDFDFEGDDYNIRNLLHVTINNNGQKLHILTHHGHHVPSHKRGDEETLRQCNKIVEYVKGLQGEVILTGDFNLEPHSESIEKINKILRNLSIEAKLITTRTSLTHKTEVCDYIFVNDKVQVKEFKVLDDVVSDHKALVLEFE